MKRNVTFSMDGDLLARVQSLAALRQTSLNEIVRCYFEHLASCGLDDQGVLNGNHQVLFDYSIGRISRSQAKRALGVNDAAFTAMLGAAQFPPPRATSEQEQEMLREVEHIVLER